MPKNKDAGTPCRPMYDLKNMLDVGILLIPYICGLLDVVGTRTYFDTILKGARYGHTIRMHGSFFHDRQSRTTTITIALFAYHLAINTTLVATYYYRYELTAS